MSDNKKEHLEKLLDKQRNIKIMLGSIGGVILIIFFFTFATLIDKAPSIFFMIEAILSVIITISFFRLNRISFAWIKMTRGNKPEFKEIISKLDAGDVDKKIDLVLQKIQ